MARLALVLIVGWWLGGDASGQRPEDATTTAGAQKAEAPQAESPPTGPQQTDEQQSGPQSPKSRSKAKRRSRRAMQRRRPMSTAIHEAWLKEVLDLDMPGAIRDYADIKKQRKDRNHPERWLAVSRLAELSRIGVIEPEPDSLPTRIPEPVREALAELQEPFPVMEVKRDPVSKHPLPSLRPATRLIQDWVRNQVGPTVTERLRLRLRERNGNSGRSVDPEQLRQWKANDILSHEIAGRDTQAEAKRKLDFPAWTAPAIEGQPQAVLAQVERRLQEWLDTEPGGSQRRRLAGLKTAIEEQAAISPANAVEFVRRLPIYAERLLLPPKPPEPEPQRDGEKR